MKSIQPFALALPLALALALNLGVLPVGFAEEPVAASPPRRHPRPRPKPIRTRRIATTSPTWSW